MSHLINIKNQNGNLVVSSREVARDFGKEHYHVIGAIENKIKNLTHEKSGVKISDLFIQSEYEHRGNIYKEYLLTRDGFSFIVMGFTGAKADQWKLKYIEAFNRMEEQIKQQIIPTELSPQLQLLISMELRQKELETKTEVLEHRVNNLDATNIEGTPRQRLNNMIKKYAYENGILYTEAWKRFRSNFNTAYRTNLELRKKNYIERNNIKNLSYPDYMERVGLIEDALRVADKMLNG